MFVSEAQPTGLRTCRINHSTPKFKLLYNHKNYPQSGWSRHAHNSTLVLLVTSEMSLHHACRGLRGYELRSIGCADTKHARACLVVKRNQLDCARAELIIAPKNSNCYIIIKTIRNLVNRGTLTIVLWCY